MIRPLLLFCIVILMVSSIGVQAGTIFKCKNSAGVLTYQEQPCSKEGVSVTSWASRSDVEIEMDANAPDGRELVIPLGQGGHYFVDATVNDNYLNFVVDTGATMVALPLSLASAAGLKCQKVILLQTGNGASKGCTVSIAKLKVGNFVLRYVDAVVMPNLSQPLLGMNVLQQFHVDQNNGQMRLTRRY